jgi:hypothetical protein
MPPCLTARQESLHREFLSGIYEDITDFHSILEDIPLLQEEEAAAERSNESHEVGTKSSRELIRAVEVEESR